MPHCRGSGLPPKPREVRRGREGAVHAHRRHKDADLHPTGQQVGLRVTREAADVATHIRCTGKDPVQHQARSPVQVLPSGVDVAGPGRGTQTRHTGGESAVQRVEALQFVLGPQGLNLRNVPPMEGPHVGLPFVVPPKVHSVLHEVRQVLAVPVADGWVRKVEVSLLGVGAGLIRRVAAGRLSVAQDPAVVLGHGEEIRVAQAWLPDASHPEVVPLVSRQLLLRLAERFPIEAEVLVVRLSLRLERVVRLVREPLEIENDRIDRVLVSAELVHDILHVLPVLPAPTRCHKPEGVLRWHERRADEGVVGLRAQFEALRGHEVQLKGVGTVPVPNDLGAVRAVLDRQLLGPRRVRNPQSCVAVSGVVIRHIGCLVADQGLCVVFGETVGVLGARAAAVELALLRAECQIIHLRRDGVRQSDGLPHGVVELKLAVWGHLNGAESGDDASSV
mmetsp:Transcript_44609/g.126093  ORF Transcript_44609/g.126093 Transcript_44609/m.126093 type:complete len:448 (-) Transcript_44609:332-1675(-)